MRQTKCCLEEKDMKGILTILVLLLVSAGAFAPAGGVGEARAGVSPDGALVVQDPGRSDDLEQGSNGDPNDSGDGHGADPGSGDGPIDDVPPTDFNLAGSNILDGLFDFLMTALPLLP